LVSADRNLWPWLIATFWGRLIATSGIGGMAHRFPLRLASAHGILMTSAGRSFVLPFRIEL
jgi:hypothetical protein